MDNANPTTQECIVCRSHREIFYGLINVTGCFIGMTVAVMKYMENQPEKVDKRLPPPSVTFSGGLMGYLLTNGVKIIGELLVVPILERPCVEHRELRQNLLNQQQHQE